MFQIFKNENLPNVPIPKLIFWLVALFAYVFFIYSLPFNIFLILMAISFLILNYVLKRKEQTAPSKNNYKKEQIAMLFLLGLGVISSQSFPSFIGNIGYQGEGSSETLNEYYLENGYTYFYKYGEYVDPNIPINIMGTLNFPEHDSLMFHHFSTNNTKNAKHPDLIEYEIIINSTIIFEEIIINVYRSSVPEHEGYEDRKITTRTLLVDPALNYIDSKNTEWNSGKIYIGVPISSNIHTYNFFEIIVKTNGTYYGLSGERFDGILNIKFMPKFYNANVEFDPVLQLWGYTKAEVINWDKIWSYGVGAFWTLAWISLACYLVIFGICFVNQNFDLSASFLTILTSVSIIALLFYMGVGVYNYPWTEDWYNWALNTDWLNFSNLLRDFFIVAIMMIAGLTTLVLWSLTCGVSLLLCVKLGGFFKISMIQLKQYN